MFYAFNIETLTERLTRRPKQPKKTKNKTKLGQKDKQKPTPMAYKEYENIQISLLFCVQPGPTM